MIYQSIPLTEVNERLPQGKTARTRLRVYARPEKGLLADGDRWAVVICPGGGYGLTAPTEGEPVALAFLAAGVQAFVLDYSVAPDRWPQSFLEAASAVAWVRAHAADYGVAPDRIAVCGFSAGGHLAGCVAGLWQHPVLREQLALAPEQVVRTRRFCAIRSSRPKVPMPARKALPTCWARVCPSRRSSPWKSR